MDIEIAETESLAVFVLDSGKINRERVHWRAIRPNDEDDERSFFRVDGLSSVQIAAIGDKEVAACDPEGRTIKGWGCLIASFVRGMQLTVKSAEPPDRHGVIIGWPPEPEKRKAFAMNLARSATPTLAPQA